MGIPIYKYKTFRDFVLDFENSPCKSFIHLQPQFDYLQIGDSVGVDFVGKFENLNDDMATIEKKIGLPHVELGIHRNSTHGYYENEYDADTKEIVYNFYKRDFKEFGYKK